jgi:ribosome recycling factor
MPQSILNKTKENMEKSVSVFVEELSRMRTGRANTSLLDGVEVEYYGSKVPLSQVATLGVPEPRMITVKPFEARIIPDIERAIMTSGLGLTPANDGKMIRVPVPQLTEERRKDLVKVAKKQAEEAKVAIRNLRRDANDALKKKQKEGAISEDDLRKYEKQVQDITDHEIKRIDQITADKEKDILQV